MKVLAKTSWYRPYNTVIFCPPTPGSTLANKLRLIVKEEEKRTGVRIKVVERAGVKLQHMLPGLTAVQLVFNPFSQFVPQLELYSQ